jgi:hypothetical protein
MTRKKFESQKEAYLDAQCKLKVAFDEIIAIEEEERNHHHHQEKGAAFSVAFAHYTNQTATICKYIYDAKKLKKFEKSDEHLAYARSKIDSWFFYNKEYPDDLVWDELIPDNIFTIQAETPFHSSSIMSGDNTATEATSEDFLSIHSKASETESVAGSVRDPNQPLNMNVATDAATDVTSVGRTPVEPSLSNGLSDSSVIPGKATGNISVDTVRDTGTVVDKTMETELPSHDLQHLQLDSDKDKSNMTMETGHLSLNLKGKVVHTKY